jgi:hypothetical protein
VRSRIFLAAVIGLAACAPIAGTRVDPRTVEIEPHPWPSPQIAAGAAPPRILALWMNHTALPSGTDWRGRIVTTTNVASVEVRTESFSFVADRTRYGDFSFEQHVLDMVPQYKRSYALQVIARNAAGDRDERLVEISFP